MRQQFERIFLCTNCKSPATIDVLLKGVMIVECPKCRRVEMWGGEDPLPTFSHLTHASQKLAEC